GLFHFDLCAHPWVNAALKKVFPFGKTGDLRRAALEDTGSCYSDVREPAGTLRNHVLSSVKRADEAASEFRHFGEGVRLAALVHHAKRGSFWDTHCVRFKVPVRVRSPVRCLRKQIGELGGCSKSNVLAETWTDCGWKIERGRITFVQSDNLCDGRRFLELRCAREQQSARD